jgi:hypothetical protein
MGGGFFQDRVRHSLGVFVKRTKDLTRGRNLGDRVHTAHSIAYARPALAQMHDPAPEAVRQMQASVIHQAPPELDLRAELGGWAC